MRCLSHVLIFKHEKCFKNHYNEMNETRVCWFCVKKLRTLGYIKNLDELLKDDYYKNFISTDKYLVKPIYKNLPCIPSS